MKTFSWPVEKEREVYESILSEDLSRKLFCNVLDEIERRAHYEESLIFDSPEIAASLNENTEKVDEILRYIFNLRSFRTSEPHLLRSGDKFRAKPDKFSKQNIETLKIKYKILSQQRKLSEYMKENLLDKKTELNEKQAGEIERSLEQLKEMHNKSTISFRWPEFLAHYELFKFKEGKIPTEKEVARFMGLKEARLHGRKWVDETRRRGYQIEFSEHVPILTARRISKKQKVKNIYNRLKREKKAVTIENLEEETSIPTVTLRKYASELELKLENVNKVRRKSKEEKVRDSYKKFSGEFLPTKTEIAEDTGISKVYVGDICKDLGLSLLDGKLLKKKQVLLTFRNLQQEGGDTEMLSDTELHDYTLDMGYEMSFNTVKKWRRELEKDGKIPVPKTREMYKPKYTKYKDAYLEIVQRKKKKGERIRFTSVAREISKRFEEPVPVHRVWKLRDVTGIPKLLDNEGRYQNIVNVFKNNPDIKMSEWAERSEVSIGFLYDALRQFRKDSYLLEKFDAPKDITNRLRVRQKPLIKAFKAIGNTNRLKILKSLSEEGELAVGEIIEELGYQESKWRNTIEYHLDVLEDAGMITIDNGNVDVTQKTESLMPAIQQWQLEEVIPEEIFGPGYNKPLFTLAISKGERKLKEIIKFMRERKGAVPFDLPSYVASERHPVHESSKLRREKFKKYLDSLLGTYEIKEDYLPFLADVIENVRVIWSPQNLIDICKQKGLDYMKVRSMTMRLADRKSINEFDLGNVGISEDESREYMNFIKDNFFNLCERVKLIVPYKSVKLEHDKRYEVDVLKVE